MLNVIQNFIKSSDLQEGGVNPGEVASCLHISRFNVGGEKQRFSDILYSSLREVSDRLQNCGSSTFLSSIIYWYINHFQEGPLPSDDDETEEDSSEGEDTVDVNQNPN